MKDRDDFVLWAHDEGFDTAIAGGRFVNSLTENAWQIWQAALKNEREPKSHFRPMSDRQLEIFVYLKDEYEKAGCFPTLRDTAEKFGVRVGNVHHTMKSLVTRGYLEKVGHGRYRLLKERAC